jgi:hypothetical protein
MKLTIFVIWSLIFGIFVFPMVDMPCEELTTIMFGGHGGMVEVSEV